MMTPMSRRRVLLHVGTPKSGTSYLQDRLARNRERLEADGLDYVATRSGDHFEAALDVLGTRWAGAEEQARGQWDELVATARTSRGDVLVSHEILAGAGPEVVERVRGSFPDHEVHVVLTARDLGRQIPAEWQERVKHRGRKDYASYLRTLQRNYGDKPTPFWRVQHLPRILATWGHDLPPERVHLVTVPPADAPRDLLWRRFSDVLGLADPASYAASDRTNASLGGVEVTALRLINLATKERELPRDPYVRWVREGLVKEVLAARSTSPPATVPPTARARVDAVVEEWLADLRQTCTHVVGDLEDLRPVWPDESTTPWSDPDSADPQLVAQRVAEAAAWLAEQAERPHEVPAPALPVPPRMTRLARRWLG
ncbi:hypothetical protein EDD33_0037 [Nocardioides aurantiacus]|uniref:Sulfotransferase family protein n=2 Tax=Nocardioides aurantiacus TaxID=86796 RepID=A0A3N2CNX7_9ACTN|nr:hypothetical protein EDD33_0037 [Nocardioides aurantiacus]